MHEQGSEAAAAARAQMQFAAVLATQTASTRRRGALREELEGSHAESDCRSALMLSDALPANLIDLRFRLPGWEKGGV